MPGALCGSEVHFAIFKSVQGRWKGGVQKYISVVCSSGGVFFGKRFPGCRRELADVGTFPGSPVERVGILERFLFALTYVSVQPLARPPGLAQLHVHRICTSVLCMYARAHFAIQVHSAAVDGARKKLSLIRRELAYNFVVIRRSKAASLCFLPGNQSGGCGGVP